jgi:hypothetical protein
MCSEGPCTGTMREGQGKIQIIRGDPPSRASDQAGGGTGREPAAFSPVHLRKVRGDRIDSQYKLSRIAAEDWVAAPAVAEAAKPGTARCRTGRDRGYCPRASRRRYLPLSSPRNVPPQDRLLAGMEGSWQGSDRRETLERNCRSVKAFEKGTV